VLVVGDIQVRQVESLTIQPGVKVIFQGRFVFEINGQITAAGTQDQPVLFTIADTTGFHNDTIPHGGWKGIRFDGLSQAVDSSLFQFCHFSYGKAVSADSLFRLGGAMSIRDFSKVKISHCLFYSNKANEKGGAIYLKNANILIAHNHFDNNSTGEEIEPWGYGGAICTDDGEPLILHNNFTNNLATGIGGALAIRFSDCPVFFNTFSGNFSAIGGAMSVLHVADCKHVISNNLIINNYGVFFGGGVSNNNSSPTWVNNTIAYNTCGSYGGAFYCKDSINPKVYNTIIWGNQAPVGSQVYLWDTDAQASFYHCNIQEGWEGFEGSGSGGAFVGEYINNIDADPLFENSAQGNYHLTNASPCIDAGTPDTTGLMIPETDLGGELRMVGTHIDMGAYENPFTTNLPASDKFYDAVFYPPFPNPAKSSVTFSFYLLQPSEVTLTIINATGQTVKTIQPGRLSTGKHSLEWAPNVPAGVYPCILSTGKQTFEQKVVVRR
jgi:predicted outer membrane repeat protein